MAVSSTMFAWIPVDEPRGVEARDYHGRWVATFTTNACTVRLTGPTRTFSEPTAQPVTHATWVRVLPAPFAGQVDSAWLQRALQANASGTADILAIAMQYIAGAPPIGEGKRQIAGDASYGPSTGASREEGSDFYDYIGIRWTDPQKTVHKPRADQLHCLDCSGFIRMTWGYRHSLAGANITDRVPLGWRRTKGALPRRAVHMHEYGPGVEILSNTGKPPRDLGNLRVGDLLFFDSDPKDGDRIDHVGMYLGKDARNQRRFISSRKSADGPTFGDFRHPSTLDGDRETDLYTRSFRAARRL